MMTSRKRKPLTEEQINKELRLSKALKKRNDDPVFDNTFTCNFCHKIRPTKYRSQNVINCTFCEGERVRGTL